MSDAAEPRAREQRIQHVRERLERDIDVWVSTANATGAPHLVPLSFLWHDESVILSTDAHSLTIRNLQAVPRVRLGFGATRDVVLVSGVVERFVDAAEIPGDLGDAFASKAGFDPRTSSGSYVYAFIRPVSIRAWREENELADRDVMRDGVWLG